MSLNEKKIFDAVFDYLNETMETAQAEQQAQTILEQIIDLDTEIAMRINSKTPTDIQLLSRKFHTYKNLLLYGDFYYESDLCQDIEEILRKTQDTNSIIDSYNDLQSSLKL